MTGPQMPAAQQGGFRQLPGGYEDAIQQAQQRAGQMIPAQHQLAPQFVQQLPPQMQQGPQFFGPPSDGLSPLQQMQQIQQQLPQQQGNQQPPQMQQQVQPGQRFGDPRLQQAPQGQFQNLQQMQAAHAAQQMQQQPGQQFQAPAGLDLNARLTGPNVPADLQGRTLGEAIAIHNGMRQVHLQMMAGQQQGAPANPPVQSPQQQAVTQGGQQVAQWDWRDPRAAVGAVVEEKMNGLMQRLEGALAPVVQASSVGAMNSAMQQAKNEIGPAFTQFESQILASLHGADPRFLANPQTWKVAAERVIGAAALQGARLQPQQQVPGLYPAQQVQLGQQPLPNLNSFFTEQPGQGGQGTQGLQLNPQQRWAAQAMGMTEADYAAYYAVTAPRPQQNGGFGR